MKGLLKRWSKVPRAMRLISLTVLFVAIGFVDNFYSHRHHADAGTLLFFQSAFFVVVFVLVLYFESKHEGRLRNKL